MYDIIIVGAGCAGLSAARTISKKIKFLILDSKKEIGYPLRCGEVIREKTFLEFFQHTNYPFVRNRVSHHIFISNNYKRAVKVNYLQVDKPRFEKWLAFPIKDKINLRQYVLSIKKTNNCLIIYTDKSVFKTKLAIIATGSVFRLQKQLGLCKHNKETTLGYGGLYKNYKLNPDKFYYFFDNKYLGYFWVFPRNKEIANIGFAALNINKDIKQVFNNLLKKYIPKAKPIFNYGGIINYSGPIKRTYTNRILVCGGAAGFVHAGTGEGIIYALTSGTIAGKIAQKALEKNNTSAKFLRFYEKKWKRLIGKELKFGLEFYQILRLTYKYSKYERLFTKPTQRDLINMVKYSKLPARANISINLLKVLGLLPKEITKRPTPKSIRMVYKLSKLFS